MKVRKLTMAAAAVAGMGALALAHHVAVPLSHLMGEDILTEVVFYTDTGTFGVPPYVHGDVEIAHGTPIALSVGDSFSIQDEKGQIETIVFDSGDFATPGFIYIEDLVATIAEKATLADAFFENGYVFFRGFEGGAGQSLELVDGVGAPLSKLGVAQSLQLGSKNIDLEVSVPADEPGDDHTDLGDHPYVVLASTKDGSFSFGGFQIPLGVDVTFVTALDLALDGALPGFVGNVDDHGDASVTLDGGLLEQAFTGGAPDELYFAFVVLSKDLSEVEFVSNRFTVDFLP